MILVNTIAYKSIVHHKQVTITMLGSIAQRQTKTMYSLKIILILHVHGKPLLPQNVQAATKHTINGEPQKKRKKPFVTLDLQHIVIKNCLKTKKAMVRLANKQLHKGKTDTALYISNIITWVRGQYRYSQ